MARNTRSRAKHSKTDVDDVDVQKVDVGGFVEPELLQKLVTDHSNKLCICTDVRIIYLFVRDWCISFFLQFYL